MFINYLDLVNKSIDYIEDHISESITFEDLSEIFYVSKHHFYRIFKAITNLTVSEYIQKRRLALSIPLLDERTSTVLEVALKSGYKSHEVFCRNFKKAFGLTPSQYRIQTPELPCFERLHIVERDFVNKNADIIVNYEIVHLDELSLTGQYVNFHTDNREAIEMAYRQVYDFAAQNVEAGGADKLYNVSLEKDASQKLSYFTGIDKSKCKKASLKKEAYKDIVTIPPATYAVFKYKGHFKYVFKTALYDLYRCVAISGYEIHDIGIKFFEVYNHDYLETQAFELYLPIKI